MKMCHNLMDSKTPVVSNTATATFRQVLTSTFERGNTESQITEKEKGNPLIGTTHTQWYNPSLRSILPLVSINDKGIEYLVHFAVHDSYLLFLDLCLRANGEVPYHLRVDITSKNTFLEIIDSVLLSHSSLFLRVNCQGRVKK